MPNDAVHELDEIVQRYPYGVKANPGVPRASASQEREQSQEETNEIANRRDGIWSEVVHGAFERSKAL